MDGLLVMTQMAGDDTAPSSGKALGTPATVGSCRDGRRATSSTTGSGVVPRRSQSDLLNHREWSGFETVAERPPQPPGVDWFRDGRRATSSTTGSGLVSRRSQSDLLNHREWGGFETVAERPP